MPNRHAHRGVLAAILAVAMLAIAACNGAAAPASSAPGASAPGSSPAPATDSPSVPASGLPSFGLPSFSSDVELESILPNEFCGQQTLKFSFSGADFVADDEDFAALVGTLGRTPADVSVASAAVQGGECENINLIAFRVKGADGGRYEQLFLALVAQDSGNQAIRKNVAGRDVWFYTDADDLATYIYFRGDTAFGVTADTEADAAKGLAVLPG
jgi:hypothetical protein